MIFRSSSLPSRTVPFFVLYLKFVLNWVASFFSHGLMQQACVGRPRLLSKAVLLSLLFLGLVSTPATASQSQNQALTNLLSQGKTKEVAPLLQAMLDKEQTASAELFYNLGCAQATAEETGAAFLSFDRALLLQPGFHEAKQNLRTLEKLGSKRFHFQKGLADELASGWKLRSWKTAFWWCLWTVVISLAVMLLRFTKARWPWIVLASLAVLGAAVTGVLWGIRSKIVDPSEISIVHLADTTARNAPAETGATVIPLPPGSQVRQLESVPGWAYVEIPGEKPTRGWVAEKSLAKLWPWEAHLVE